MIIGITGGIGSGKSTIARELARRGYSVYDCDVEAKRIIAEDKEVQRAIIKLLSAEAFRDGKYNTEYVAKRVFENINLLGELNAIVHPAVVQDIKHTNPDFVESAILYEAGLDKICKKVIFIDAPEKLRISRTIARDGCDEQSVKARIKSQQTLPPKDAILIRNDGKSSIEFICDTIEQKIS